MIESDLINNNFLVFLLLNIHLKISFSKNLKSCKFTLLGRKGVREVRC